MADGTRLRCLDEGLQEVKDSNRQMQALQQQLRGDVDTIASSLEDTKKLLHQGLTETAATWEDKLTLQKSFPSLHLEDKVVVKEGSNVMDQMGSNKQTAQMGQNQTRRSPRATRKPGHLEDYQLSCHISLV
ncbi:hypothetical protein E3N88_19252 [Mikania micrantha]|uniref:Uncharacterized protein n=1 Tax=Mikania micrantha TaxID=192012 RepID=A0A5N6NMN1_9ASTR|nr:hypothetical protein E3N88_19252 [Mikania micrantha]